MRYLSLIFAIICMSSFVKAQNDFIRGPEFLCNPSDSVEYTLVLSDPNQPLEFVEWSITPTPGAEISSQFENVVYVNFQWGGQYILVATYLNANGETSQTEMFIWVEGFFGEPVVEGCGERNDSTQCYQVCAFSETTITQESYNGTSTFWTVTGAESYVDNGLGLEIVWGPGGTGTVEYFTECQGSGTICFEILPEPVADFNTIPDGAGADTITICKGQEVYFENTSENGITYNWFFGDGAESESYDANHAYEETGFFTAKLVAGSACDCSSEKEIVFEVLDAPAPTLDCVNSVCPETRQKYTATTDGCTVFNWSISGNGTIVNGGESTDDFIEVIWHSGPDGIINLSVSNCAITYCSFSNTFRVPIITPDGPVEGDQSVCSGEIATYTAPFFPGTVYNWQVSSRGTIMGSPGSNAVTIKWDNVNATVVNEQVSVNYNNCFLECSGEDNIAVQITPTLSLTGDMQVCMGDEASCTAQSGFTSMTPANVAWEIRDEDDQVVFASAGLLSTFNHTFNYPAGIYYWVALNNSPDYCNGEIRLRISVTEKPETPLGIEGELEICPGVTYGYSIQNAGEYETNWVVTDGANITNYQGQVINHVFGMSPPYSVEARHINVQFPDCDSDPVTITMTNAADKEIVGNEEACYQSIEIYTIDFIGGSSYEWEIIPADHGDIQSQSSNEIAVFWTQSGPATVQLSACGVIVDLAVTVHDLPIFTVLGPTEVCANETATFSTDQPTLAHAWRDQDGTLVGSDPTADLFPGFYSVTVTDNFGCETSEAFDLRIIPAPNVSISSPIPSFSCAENAIPLVANTDGDDFMFVWYRDGTMVGTGPTHTGAGFGEYYVEVTNQYGCVDRSGGFVYGECCQGSECEREYTECPNSCPALSTDFDLETSNTECQIKTYTNNSVVEPGSESWLIKRLNERIGSFSGALYTHEYELPGYYTIISRARLNGFPYENNNCFHFEVFIDSVLLVADYDVNIACAGEEFEFEDLTTFLPGHSITGWAWDFGDPTSGGNNMSTDQNPRHTFATPGTYDVTLTAQSGSGCVSTKTKQIIVSGGPDLIVDYDMINCENEATGFNLTGNVFNIGWDFGDPTSGVENTAEVATVLHTYNSAANYNVSVTAEDVFQCSATTQVAVDIRPNTLAGDIDVQLSNQFCQGESATLTAPSGGNYWEWSNEEQTEAITVETSDEYSVFIRDEFNCTYTTPAEFIEVLPKPVVVVRARVIYGPGEYGPWVDNLEVCDDVEFEIHAISTQSLNYNWVGGQTIPVLVFAGDGGGFPGPGTHTFTVTGEDPTTGCAADDQSITVVIHGLPSFPMIALGSGSGCSFDENVLSVTNVQPGVTYVWSDGQEGNQITITESGDYYVTAINEFGCERNSSNIRINPSASVEQLPAGCHIACDPLTVCLPALSNVASYIIYQNGSVFMSGTSWPSDFLIDQDGSYTIEVTSTNGCVATSDPLDVLLYIGTGVVTVSTYVDVDNDGLISAADTLIGGIHVDILSADGMHEGHTDTEAGGRFDFVDYPNSTYLASIDRDRLSSMWLVVIDSLNADITNCGDSVNVSLLLTENCQVIGPDLLLELCPGEMISVGDSTWSDTGNYVLHYLSFAGCDSIVNVDINLPDSFNIDLNVWFDLDDNMIVGGSDTLLPGIPILITDLNSGASIMGSTDASGGFSLLVPVGDYRVAIDTSLLSSGLDTIFWSTIINATDLCGMGGPIDFLLGNSCELVSITESESICFGDSLMINGIWYDESGNYPYTVDLDGDGCDTLIDFTLTVLPEIDVVVDIFYDCNGLATVLLSPSGTGPFTYDWSPSVAADSVATNLSSGTYSVTVTDANMCATTETIFVEPQPILSFALDTLFEIIAGEMVVLEITGSINEPGLQVVWSPTTNLSCGGCFAPLAMPSQTTEYQATITDANGCTYTLTTRVEVTPQAKVFVPSAFTPDDDGLNDYFRIMSDDDGAVLIRMSIINRWGNIMYEEINVPVLIHQGWNGTSNGKKLDNQVVLYTLEVLMSDGRTEMMSGDVTLVR